MLHAACSMLNAGCRMARRTHWSLAKRQVASATRRTGSQSGSRPGYHHTQASGRTKKINGETKLGANVGGHKLLTHLSGSAAKKEKLMRAKSFLAAPLKALLEQLRPEQLDRSEVFEPDIAMSYT